MMREILFRGKRVDNGEWVEGLYSRKPGIYKEYEHSIIWHEGIERSSATGTCGYFEYGAGVRPETIGQFTGLLDKNGKKIFEGDIVRIAYCFGWDDEKEKDVPEEEYISKVYSIDGCPFCVDLLHCDSDMTPIAWLDWSYDDAEIEVIGNIHDNPELLKGGER